MVAAVRAGLSPRLRARLTFTMRRARLASRHPKVDHGGGLPRRGTARWPLVARGDESPFTAYRPCAPTARPVD
jgi:hypothetical protein